MGDLNVGHHVKTQWAIRGGHERSVLEAWDGGTQVKLPNYSYSEARYDEQANIVFLRKGDRVATVVILFDHIEVTPMEEVACAECGKVFEGREDCPSCGSDEWRCL